MTLNRRTLLLLLIITTLPAISYAQDLISSRTTSYYTYIYRITDREAERIYKRGFGSSADNLFHTLIDSVATDSDEVPDLPPGHYLKTYSDKGTQQLFIATVPALRAYVMNNNTDLSVQITDLEGNIISDAKVSLGLKRLRYDEKTRSYTDRRSNREGILTVQHEGKSFFFEVTRITRSNPGILRGPSIAVNSIPLRYVWRPVRYVVMLPVDGVRSISRGYPTGTIRRTRSFFFRSFNRIASHFDQSYSSSQFVRYDGFMVFNKPKYMPGDTVKYKAYLTNPKSGKPITEALKIKLIAPGRTIELGLLEPYADGGYHSSFFLHDSLRLQLDRSYTIRLENSSGRSAISAQFIYEDYELAGNSVSLRTSSSEHYAADTLALFIDATDENDLKLADARYELAVITSSITEYGDSYVFVADTLLYTTGSIDATGDTEVKIPGSIFPQANLRYRIAVAVRTPDNEVIRESTVVEYQYLSQKLTALFAVDSVRFDFLRNGISMQDEITITASDRFGHTIELYSGTSPHTLPLNNHYATYSVTRDTLTRQFLLSGEESLLSPYTRRTSDSIFIRVVNPRKIPFTYNLYALNSERERGHATTLNLTLSERSKKNYYLSIRYIWGGLVKSRTYKIEFGLNNLNIDLKEPNLVFPGQSTTIELEVTDIYGKPVRDADVTAWSVTGKFNYKPPGIDAFRTGYRERRQINNYSLKQSFRSDGTLLLNYEAWKVLAGIDSIEYYRFLYPGNSIYRFEYPTPERTTEFAPFVFRNGQSVPVHVIYVNNSPVWFSWSTNERPYSFAVIDGVSNVDIRTDREKILIDSLFFTSNVKTILSIDLEGNAPGVEIINMPQELTPGEKSNLNRYIFPYRNNFGAEAYIHSQQGYQLLQTPPGTQLIPLRSATRNIPTRLAGPVSGPVTLTVTDGYSHTFMHEPLLEYDFFPGVIKMRSIDTERLPSALPRSTRANPLDDHIVTQSSINRNRERIMDARRQTGAVRGAERSSDGSNARLLINYTPTMESATVMSSDDEVFYNIVIFAEGDSDEFVRMLPASASRYTVSWLKEGYYRVLFLYKGAKYHVQDSVYLRNNGVTYLQVDRPEVLRHDEYSVRLDAIIGNSADVRLAMSRSTPVSTGPPPRPSFRPLFDGDNITIEGWVHNESNEPFPYVTIYVSGDTRYGALTDEDGYYSLIVPQGEFTLVYNFVGYKQVTRRYQGERFINVTLEPDILALDEVVVVGFGESRRGAATTAIYGSRAPDFPPQMMVRGVTTTVSGDPAVTHIVMPEMVGPLSVKGVSITPGTNPLIIVNGRIFLGDITKLDEDKITNIVFLDGKDAYDQHGQDAINGVIVITTTEDLSSLLSDPHGRGVAWDDDFLEAVSGAGSLRSNFSDYAFWIPDLRTDADGRASFEVTFPDDITRWDTFYRAINGNRQSGEVHSSIRSYKPLMARLSTPRFLVEGDSATAIGRVLNYLPDSVSVTTSYEIDNRQIFSTTRECSEALTDTLHILAGSDSLTLTYQIETADGYYDGERRMIGVYRRGLEESAGRFVRFDRDTTVTLHFDEALGDVTIYARADLLSVMESEVVRLTRYRYNCNEQIASRLKGLIAERRIATARGESAGNDRQIRREIRMLENNQRPGGLWGWWKESPESDWISLHVLEALTEAGREGFPFDIATESIVRNIVWRLENSPGEAGSIRLIKIAQMLEATISYDTYISEIENGDSLSLMQMLQLMEIKQGAGIAFSTDTLRHYQDTTMLGSIFFRERRGPVNWYSLIDNPLQTTLQAYKVLRADSTTPPQMLMLVRYYMLEQRGSGFWRNTYESSQIVGMFLIDIISEGEAAAAPRLNFKGGGLPEEVTEFPFEATMAGGGTLIVTMTGSGSPVYLTGYQRYFNTDPTVRDDDFVVRTRFEDIDDQLLEAGREVTLIVDLEVKRDADYVMINVPIPGGCSYVRGDPRGRYEVHREYYRNETVIFCEKLPKGQYRFTIRLMPRFTGSYTLNPAKAELMYFPTFRGNNELKRVVIGAR